MFQHKLFKQMFLIWKDFEKDNNIISYSSIYAYSLFVFDIQWEFFIITNILIYHFLNFIICKYSYNFFFNLILFIINTINYLKLKHKFYFEFQNKNYIEDTMIINKISIIYNSWYWKCYIYKVILIWNS